MTSVLLAFIHKHLPPYIGFITVMKLCLPRTAAVQLSTTPLAAVRDSVTSRAVSILHSYRRSALEPHRYEPLV